MKNRTLNLFWVALAVPVAFFAGRALVPGAALYTQVFPQVTLDWLGAVPKLVFCALGVLGGLAVTSRFEAGNPSRTAWRLWTAGLAGTLLGQLVLTWYFAVEGKTSVFPSLGDLFFVAGSLALIASLVAFVRAYEKSGFPIGSSAERWGIGLGAAVLSAVLVVPVLWPVLATPAPPLEKLLNMAYPALDFLMLIPALLLLRISLRFWGGRVWTVWALLIAGILATAAGDVLFGYFSGLGKVQLDALIDVAFILGYGLFAASVLYQRDLLAR